MKRTGTQQGLQITNPYNFVPTNELIIPGNSDAVFDRYDTMRRHGFIDIGIKPMKPVFIRGIGNEFYKAGDKFAIPGSTIKGMIRHLIEVISFSETTIYNSGIKNKEGELKTKLTQHYPSGIPSRDFVMTLFGKDAERQGKLIFEDAKCEKEIPTDHFSLKVLKILFSPMPEETKYYTGKRNGGIYLKGNKFFWHRDDLWFDDALDPAKEHKHNPTANVLVNYENVFFAGRIRFENLTDEELGILLMALNLRDSCCHHIGMAKPYGLGRIRIQTAVTEIDRNKRYNEVFDESGNWNMGEVAMSNDRVKEIKNRAAHYLLSAIGESSDQQTAEDLFWHLPRMMDLLDLHRVDPYGVSSSIWQKETAYPGNNRTKGPRILKSVREIRERMNQESRNARRNGD